VKIERKWKKQKGFFKKKQINLERTNDQLVVMGSSIKKNH
jgi:hypothetical protein